MMAIIASRHTRINNSHASGVVCTEVVHTELETYCYVLPPIAAAANEDFFDLFNASGSGKIIRAVGLYVRPELDVTASPTLAIRIDAYRTSAVGTGGTAYNYKSATRDVAGGNICPLDTTNTDISADVTDLTARQEPTGGATVSEWLTGAYFNGAEADESGFNLQNLNLLYPGPFCQLWTFREGQGLLVRQGAVASSGDIALTFVFTME